MSTTTQLELHFGGSAYHTLRGIPEQQCQTCCFARIWPFFAGFCGVGQPSFQGIGLLIDCTFGLVHMMRPAFGETRMKRQQSDATNGMSYLNSRPTFREAIRLAGPGVQQASPKVTSFYFPIALQRDFLMNVRKDQFSDGPMQDRHLPQVDAPALHVSVPWACCVCGLGRGHRASLVKG